MHTSKPQRVTALLAVLALLFAALPAAAAAPPRTDRPEASEPGVIAPLVHRLTTWLGALWPGFGSQPAWDELGSVADPGGAPQSLWQELGSVLDPGGQPESAGSVPTATPQLGPDGDPNI